MTWVHAVRGLYLGVSLAVALTAIWRSGEVVLQRHDRLAALAFAAYALSIAAAQGYAFNQHLTVGTGFVGFGVLVGAAWLVSLRVIKAGG